MTEFLDNLYVRQVAQIRYMQEEHNTLMVDGQFESTTKTVYKALQKNTSAFTPESLETLKMAVTLTQYRSNIQQHHQPSQGHFNRFSGGRGNFGRGAHSRPFFNPNPGYQPRSVPISYDNNNIEDVQSYYTAYERIGAPRQVVK